jgi:hypothetical protein
MITKTPPPAPRHQVALVNTEALCKLWLSTVQLGALWTIWWSFS